MGAAGPGDPVRVPRSPAPAPRGGRRRPSRGQPGRRCQGWIGRTTPSDHDTGPGHRGRTRNRLRCRKKRGSPAAAVAARGRGAADRRLRLFRGAWKPPGSSAWSPTGQACTSSRARPCAPPAPAISPSCAPPGGWRIPRRRGWWSWRSATTPCRPRPAGARRA